MSSAAEALENLSASLSLLYSEADAVMRRENAQPSMLSYYLARIGDQFAEIERCNIGLLSQAGSEERDTLLRLVTNLRCHKAEFDQRVRTWLEQHGVAAEEIAELLADRPVLRSKVSASKHSSVKSAGSKHSSVKTAGSKHSSSKSAGYRNSGVSSATKRAELLAKQELARLKFIQLKQEQEFERQAEERDLEKKRLEEERALKQKRIQEERALEQSRREAEHERERVETQRRREILEATHELQQLEIERQVWEEES